MRSTTPTTWLRGMMRAPVVVVPCSSKAAYLRRYAEPDKGWTDLDEARWPVPFWHMDAAMASLLILQTAVDAGLGGCFFGIPPERVAAVREEFAIPDAFDPVGAITLGHPAAEQGAAGSPSRRPRKDPAEVVHRGSWGRRQARTGVTCVQTTESRLQAPPQRDHVVSHPRRARLRFDRVRSGGTFRPSSGGNQAKGDRT